MKEAGDVEEVDVAHVPRDEPEGDADRVPGGAGGVGDQVEHVACPAEEEHAGPAHPDEERNRFLRFQRFFESENFFSLFVYLCPGAVHEDHGGEEAAHAGQDRLQDLSGDPGSDDGGADHDELEDGDGRHGALEGHFAAAHPREGKCRIGRLVRRLPFVYDFIRV